MTAAPPADTFERIVVSVAALHLIPIAAAYVWLTESAIFGGYPIAGDRPTDAELERQRS
jgi:hypothetical protein